jgi:hypothetical protein
MTSFQFSETTWIAIEVFLQANKRIIELFKRSSITFVEYYEIPLIENDNQQW